MIQLIKPNKPDEKLLNEYLNQILDSGYYTNNGPLLRQLEVKLGGVLGSNHLLLTSNGTVSLEILLKHFCKPKSNIVTTPYSYVATANAAAWLGLEVRFADLEKESFFPRLKLLEELIDENTSAILITQVYGLCGPLDKYQALAKKYNVALILDAAHAFGVKYKGRSVAQYGDAASFSFHSTKVFNTVEGGAICLNDDSIYERIFNLRSFGHRGDEYYSEGINGKNSEVHAAFGLAQIDSIDANYLSRKRIFNRYKTEFSELPFKLLNWDKNEIEWNYCYFPIILENEQIRERLRSFLIENGIMARRYFYPSLNTLSHLKKERYFDCPNSEHMASKVLCIPHYASLGIDDQSKIIQAIFKFFSDR